MFLLAASIFFTNPVPLDMPRAEAYLVKEDGRYRLEDRYDVFDLWTSRTVLGRWEDDECRRFTVARLDARPPFEEAERVRTRTGYVTSCREFGAKDDLYRTVSLLAPDGIAEKPRPSRQLPRGLKDVRYWQHPTNFTSIVCAFLPEKSRHWYLAVWELAEGDDYPERMFAFEREFLDVIRSGKGLPAPFAEMLVNDERRERKPGRRDRVIPNERELLRADALHSVTNYANWHFTDSPEFVVLDDLDGTASFIPALTNDLRTMRRKYAEALPTHIDGSNVLCVARIFGSRDEYLDVIDEDMSWTAAYWSPQRRELVAYLPSGGERDLLKTVRHEAFHQYLSYATSMIPVSPWLNEGYAQYFEDVDDDDWGYGNDVTPEWIETASLSIRGVLAMDYLQFYDGTDAERRFKYRLAWSIARFLELGAPKVRFLPFKNLKADYMRELFESQDMRKATSAAFRNEDTLKLFISEWVKYWSGR